MKKQILSVSLLVLLNFSIFYASFFTQSIGLTTQDIDGDTRQDNPLFDVEREIQAIEDEFYTPSYSNFRPGPLNANNISTDLSTSQKDLEAPIIINIDLEKQVISPGSTLNYVIQVTRGLEPVAGETFTLEIIEGEYWGWYFYWLEDYTSYEDRINETKPITTGSDGEYKGQFNPPSSGRYSIVIRSSTDHIQEVRPFTVANIGLFWRVSSECVSGETISSVAYVLNIADFSPVPNAEIELSGVNYDYNPQTQDYEIQTEQLFSGNSNDQGIVEINFEPPSSIDASYHFLANLSASYNGETVYVSRDIYRGGYYWGWDGYAEYQKYEFIVTTDKPIYSPGETIQARILLWQNDYLKVIKEPAQTSFVLKFLSPSQHVLLHRQVTTNSYGVATYSFSLDTESELGNYNIVTQKEETISSLQIRVDKYEKPAFRVILGLDHEYVAPGKTISGNVTAEYYFGKPVAGSEVEVTIGTLEVLTGITDLNGYWEFKYKLPGVSSLEDISTIPINATVIDTVGREVSSSSAVQITDEVYVWAYVNPWFPKMGENITIYFGAYQYSDWGWMWWNWRPLTNVDVEIKLYGMFGTHFQLIETLHSKTDINGQGQIELNLPTAIFALFSRFRGVVEVDAGDGRKGSSTFYFTVDSNSVEVNLGTSTYQAGDLVELEVFIRNMISNTSIDGSLKFRIFDSDYDLIGENIRDISAQGSVFEFQLSSYAPNGKYIMYFFLETTFDYEYGSWTYYRYSKTVEFYVGPAHQISLTADKSSYTLTDSLSISGEIQGKTNAPVMIQFVKKGIVTNKYIDVSSITDFNIQIKNIQFLAPRFWVYSFAILEDGTILETCLNIEIDTTLLVEVYSDKSVYEPGDTAKISIEIYDSSQQPVPTVLAVSFIDSSVFGVQPDPETEREHFNEQEYWPSVWTVVSWRNRQRSWWFWWYDVYPIRRGGSFGLNMEEGIYQDYAAITDDRQTPAPTAMKGEETEEKSAQKEIRDYLPENAYWTPLKIVENGYLEINLPLPDTIGEWTVRIVATTQSGLGILHKHSFKTFLPFFVEINKEPFVLQDDVFIIKGIAYNYLEDIANIALEIKTETGILLLGRNTQDLRLPSGFLGSIGWACLAQDVGFFNITLYGNATLKSKATYNDAIRKSLEIIPNGISSEFKTSGFIANDTKFSYTRYSEAVQKTEFLVLSLGYGPIALNSWERLIKYPYGCTEQTISCLIPDALILQYLEETGELDNETEEIIHDMIISGLSRLYSQQHNDGGWGWWRDDSSRVYMTSIVLYGLGIVNKSGFHVDSSVVKDSLNMLETRQNSGGSWTPDSWRGVDQTAFTAFVLRSILQWRNLLDTTTVVVKAINHIETDWNGGDKQSAYLAGLYLDSVPDSGLGSLSFEAELLTFLKNNITSDGSYWSYKSTKYSWWRALGGDVEVTSLALKALVENDRDASIHIIPGAVQWLLQRQSWYGWGNTADTVAAISTIIALCQNDLGSNEDADVTLCLEEETRNYNLSTSSQVTFYIDLDEYLGTGKNDIELKKEGVGDVSYYFYSNQILRSLPTISLQAEISSPLGQQVVLPLTLTNTSSQVFASNLIVTPLAGEVQPTIDLPWSITQLTQQTVINFNYTAPSEVGTYEILGFEITYQLSNWDQTQFSPGIITRKYGPIQLEVTNPAESIILAVSPLPDLSPRIIVEKPRPRLSSTSDLELERIYSQVGGFQKGDLIYVTLTITNTKQIENFLMLEDYIPIGFDLDESTIEHSAETYEITTSGITFFFPELKIGPTVVKYGLIAMSVRQSLVSPAKLSSMYDEWIKTSSAAILGDTRIPIDPATGAVIKDLQIPALQSMTLEETLLGSKGVLDIKVNAFDNWGIASVRVFIKQASWNMFECSKEEEVWRVTAAGLQDGKSQIYVEIIDYAGNVLVSEPFSQYLDLNDLVVPILPILGLLSVAMAIAVVSSLYVRKRQK